MSNKRWKIVPIKDSKKKNLPKRVQAFYAWESGWEPTGRWLVNNYEIKEDFKGTCHIWLKIHSDEWAVCAGYFLAECGNTGPFESVKWLNFDYHWVNINLSSFYYIRGSGVDQTKVKAFQDYMTNNNITWL